MQIYVLRCLKLKNIWVGKELPKMLKKNGKNLIVIEVWIEDNNLLT